MIKLIYDTGKDVRKMNLLDYESEILRKTVKDRFESRIWPQNTSELENHLLNEFLNIVYSLAILDYPWNGVNFTFNFENRGKFIDDVFEYSDLISSLGINKNEFKKYIFEDLSLLFVTNHDNLSWIHENLREHAISNGLIKLDNNNLIKNIVSNWEIDIPSINDVMYQSGKLCSSELTKTLIKNLP